MRKFLLLLSFLVTFGMASATVSDVTFSESGYSNAQAIVSFKAGDVEFTFDKATASTAATYYDTDTGIRVYNNSKITVKAPAGKTITNIAFTAASSYGFGNSTVSTGTFTVGDPNSSATWTGDANEIVITVAAANKHWRWQALSVTYGDGSGTTDPEPEPEPEPDPTPSGDEGVVAFYAQGATYSGTGDPKVEVTGTLCSTKDQAGTTFTATDVCSINWTKKNSSNSNVNSGLIRWYANDILTITPVAGVTVSKVLIHYKQTTYAGKTLTASVATTALTNETDAQTYT